MSNTLASIQGVIDGIIANGATAFIAAIPALFHRASRAERDRVTDAAARYDTTTDRTAALDDIRELMSSYLTRYPAETAAFERWGKTGTIIENHAPNQGQQGNIYGGTFNNHNA